jgi:hypothetical protein
MEIIDVTDKYPVTGLHWKLNVLGQGGNEFGLGEYMQCVMVMRPDKEIDVTKVDVSVIDHALKVKGVNRYYVRNSMSRSLFSLFGGFGVDDDVYDDVWRMYNRDPWGRKFPKFVDGSVEDMYINSSYANRVSYGFWVYYRDRVITSNSDIRDDTNYGVRYISEVPLLILHTSTIEGVTVACLDVVKVNQI